MGGRQKTTLFMTEGKSSKESATKPEEKTPKKGKKQ